MRASGTSLINIGRTLQNAGEEAEFRSCFPDSIQWVRCPQLCRQSQETRWQALQISTPSLSIVAVSYKQQKALLSFLASLECQTCSSFNVLILHDGPCEETADVFDRYQQTSDLDLSMTFSAQRHNDWGHSLRRMGLQQADGDYVLITNAYNYYAPRFVEFALRSILENELDMLHFDMIHSHDKPALRPVRSYQTFVTAPFAMSIDMGAFIVRREVAQQVGFRHCFYHADGLYLEDLLKSGMIKRIGHLDKVLLVHN